MTIKREGLGDHGVFEVCTDTSVGHVYLQCTQCSDWTHVLDQLSITYRLDGLRGPLRVIARFCATVRFTVVAMRFCFAHRECVVAVKEGE